MQNISSLPRPAFLATSRIGSALKTAGAVFALALLAACAEGEGPSFEGLNLSAARAGSAGKPAAHSIAVARGQITIAGPPGYCIDRRGSQLMGGAAFVLMASCATVSQAATVPGPVSPGLLTASVEKNPGDAPSPSALQSFLSSPTGRAAMARDGQAASLTVLEKETRDGALLMRVRDTSANNPEELQADYWRAMFSLNGHLITATAKGFASRPLSSDSGYDKLVDLMARSRTETEAANSASKRETASPPKKSLFSGLLR